MDWLALEGRSAIVTGGASGIGLAVSQGLAEVGVNVVIADVNEAAGEKSAAELGGGGSHSFIKTNVAERSSVESLMKETLVRHGHLDILINNAGINIPRLLVDPAGKEELSDEIWDKTVAVNQRGLFICAQSAARSMLENTDGGVIINMASESGLEGSEGQSAYAATKAAVYSLTRSWAKELGRHGIRVVGLAPGILEVTALRTEEYERALAYTRGVTVEKLREGYKKQSIPLGRSGKLTEVADTVVYLASSRSSYVHGTVINISGGKSRA